MKIATPAIIVLLLPIRWATFGATVDVGIIPVVFAILGGHLDEVDAVAEYSVERFIASYTT